MRLYADCCLMRGRMEPSSAMTCYSWYDLGIKMSLSLRRTVTAMKGQSMKVISLAMLGAAFVAAPAFAQSGAQPSASQAPEAMSAAAGPALINVLTYGAKGDGVTDDSAAIKAAFAAIPRSGHVTVYFPPAPGKAGYRYCPASSPTIDVTSDYVTIRGESWASVIRTCQTQGDFLHFHPSADARRPNVQEITIRDMVVYASGRDPADGALIHLENTDQFRIADSDLLGYYGEIYCEGCSHGSIDANLRSDVNFTHLATGSYLFKAGLSARRKVPTEVHIAKADWRGMNSNNFLQYGVLITGADGIWFDDLHVGMAQNGIGLMPADDRTPLGSILINNGYVDTVSAYGLVAQAPDATYAGGFGGHVIHLANTYKSGDDAVHWNVMTRGDQFWSNLSLGRILEPGHNGVNIVAGQKINILPGWTIQGPGMGAQGDCAAASTCNGILVQAPSENINIGFGVVDKGRSPKVQCAIDMRAGVTRWTFDTGRSIGPAFGMCDETRTPFKSPGHMMAW